MTYLRQWHVPGDDDDLASFDAASAWLDGQITLGRLARLGRTEPATAGILAVIAEPLGLAGAQLPAYGVPEAGCCRDCLRPPVHSQGLCVYCTELARDGDDAGEPCRCPGCQATDRNLGRAAILLILLIIAEVAIMWAGGMIT